MSMDGGVMKMRPLPNGIEIKPGETVELQARRHHHLMFVGLKAPFEQAASGSRVRCNSRRPAPSMSNTRSRRSAASPKMDQDKMDHGGMDHGKQLDHGRHGDAVAGPFSARSKAVDLATAVPRRSNLSLSDIPNTSLRLADRPLGGPWCSMGLRSSKNNRRRDCLARPAHNPPLPPDEAEYSAEPGLPGLRLSGPHRDADIRFGIRLIAEIRNPAPPSQAGRFTARMATLATIPKTGVRR